MASLAELLSNPDTAGVWTLAPDRSKITFTTRTFWGLVPVKGTFGDFDGAGQLTGSGSAFGRVDIRATSLNTGIGKRDEHLRSADFFDVERFPTLSFVVTAVTPTAPGEAELRGDLTIKETTRPIELATTVTVLDDGAIRVSGGDTINRFDFGVDGNTAGMVGKPTKIAGDLVFTRDG